MMPVGALLVATSALWTLAMGVTPFFLRERPALAGASTACFGGIAAICLLLTSAEPACHVLGCDGGGVALLAALGLMVTLPAVVAVLLYAAFRSFGAGLRAWPLALVAYTLVYAGILLATASQLELH